MSISERLPWFAVTSGKASDFLANEKRVMVSEIDPICALQAKLAIR